MAGSSGRMRKIIALAVTILVTATASVLSETRALAAEVRLTVDGVTTVVRSNNDNVARVLVENGICLGEHDFVSPSLDSPASGRDIVVRHGRPLSVTLDGRERTVWTTGLTVAEALPDIQLRTTRYELSVSPDTPIGRDGLAFSISTDMSVIVQGPTGGPVRVKISAGNVEDALAAVNLRVDDNDIVSYPLGSPLFDGQVIQVTRVDITTDTSTTVIPYRNINQEDPTLPKGTTKVKVKGVNGRATETWRQIFANGLLAKADLLASDLVVPVNQITLIGTYVAPVVVAPPPSTTSSSSSTPTSSGTSTGSGTSGSTTIGTCYASWYESGTITANGEPYNPDGLTAASLTFKFNTMLKVTNVKTGASVVVRINDRGPYVDGRCLDLSRGAFATIGDLAQGVMLVTYEVVG